MWSCSSFALSSFTVFLNHQIPFIFIPFYFLWLNCVHNLANFCLSSSHNLITLFSRWGFANRKTGAFLPVHEASLYFIVQIYCDKHSYSLFENHSFTHSKTGNSRFARRPHGFAVHRFVLFESQVSFKVDNSNSSSSFESSLFSQNLSSRDRGNSVHDGIDCVIAHRANLAPIQRCHSF